MKRLFIAADLDEATRAAVGRICAALRDATEVRVTWVHQDRLHLTLEFLGEVDPAVERRVISALVEPISVAPFDLRFEGLWFFPPSGVPRVLWLGVAEGLDALRLIHGDLQRRLGRDRGAGEDFSPHLTLARFRERAPRTRLKELADTRASAGPCRIDRVTLYESRLSSNGPSYMALAAALLKPCT